MTTFTFTKVIKPAADLGGESSLPPLDDIPLKEEKPPIGYDDTRGLFTGYGYVYTSFPHRAQDNYKRDLKEKELDAVILENDYLRAEFIPSVGGKLWSLYDKKEKRDLLFNNPVLRYCNLSTRNAWTSGGVEFNIGERGHHAYTCDTLFTAKTELSDGTPVLRFYEYNRIRSVVYQVDFWLPEESKVLFCRVRIVNNNTDVRPMYWWSNAAVPDWEKGRVIVPAEEAYAYDYKSGLFVVPIPYRNEMDKSYNKNNSCSDTFYIIPEEKRRFICYADKDGYAYAHTSTRRLKSRKMFVWGNGVGGQRWQEFLSGNGNPGSYIELQAGIANTQEEHLPMPPLTAWEWVETYGAVKLDKDLAHSEDYKAAIFEAEKQLDKIITSERLEEILAETKDMALSPAKEVLISGSGWGALENERRKQNGEKLLPEHLDFGEIKDAQIQWEMLLKEGSIGEHEPNDVPKSWMKQDEWTELMEEAIAGNDKENWYTYLQLGCSYLSMRQFRFAKENLEKSMELKPNCWALYALSRYEKIHGNKEKAADLVLKAAQMNPSDISLACAASRTLHEVGKTESLIDFIKGLDDNVASNSRIRLYYTYSLLRMGNIAEADEAFYKDGGINVVDIKEAEISITDLWFDLEEAKAKKDGKDFDRSNAIPPKQFDFRMTV